MITRKALARRTFLRGMGASVALPFLDSMVPALATAATTPKPPVRMAFVYVPNGMDMRNWAPGYEGKLDKLPRILKPLEPFKQDINVLGNLTHNAGRALLDGAGDHGRCIVRPSRRERNRFEDTLQVARNRNGGFAPGRRLRLRLFLRVHEQPRLAQRNAATASDSQSAGSVRQAVR